MSITKKENVLWDEKNSTEPKTKSESNGGLGECDITTDINGLSENEHSTDIIRSKSGRKIIDLRNQRFGKLVVVSYAGIRSKKDPCSLWLCRCDCNNTKIVRSDLLKEGMTKSCGCLYARKGEKSPGWKGYNGLSKTVVTRIRHDAKQRNIPFNLTLEFLWRLYIKQNKKCALTGIVIDFGTTGRDRNRTASLDRINSENGYTKGNVQWVHKDVNFSKQDMSQKEFITMCNKVAFHQLEHLDDYVI